MKQKFLRPPCFYFGPTATANVPFPSSGSKPNIQLLPSTSTTSILLLGVQ